MYPVRSIRTTITLQKGYWTEIKATSLESWTCVCVPTMWSHRFFTANIQVSSLCPSCTDIRNVIVSVLNCGYRSESPTQVFVILLHWLFENLSSIPVPEDQWSEVIIAYDNMCQLDSLQIAKNPLPLPFPFDKIWMAVRKVHHMLPDNDI